MEITGETVLRREFGDRPRNYWYEGSLKFNTRYGEFVPTPFLTDLATIPRILWWVPGLGPDDWVEAAVLHDWCYVEHKRNLDFEMTRKEADQLLYDAMVASDQSVVISWVCWAACRLAGGWFWNQNVFGYHR